MVPSMNTDTYEFHKILCVHLLSFFVLFFTKLIRSAIVNNVNNIQCNHFPFSTTSILIKILYA